MINSLFFLFDMAHRLTKDACFIKRNVCYVIFAGAALILGGVFLTPLHKAYAQQDLYAPMSGKDRTLVIEGLRAVKRNDWKRAEKQFAAAQDPLAAKLYYWLVYTKEHGNIEFTRVTRFIESNPQWPWQARLALNAEKAIDKKDTQADIIKWFDKNAPRTSDGMDYYLHALYEQGQAAKARDIAREWWGSTLLSPEGQRDFYAQYRDWLDQAAHIKRWNRLLFADHYTNARRIAGLLPEGYAALTEARIALAEQQSGVNDLIDQVPQELRRDPGFMYERLRWRRRADMDFRAIEILHTAPPIEEIPNVEDWWRERHILARRFIENKQYESAYELVSKHKQEEGFAFAQAEFLAGWLALEHVKKPWRAFEHFEALYYRTTMPVSKSRGAYWAGKASLALGHKEIADKWFATAAQYQTAFYGQLGLERLRQEGNITEFKPPLVMPETRAYFERNELVRVARLLYKADMRNETGAFLDALSRDVDTAEEYMITAELARDLGQPHKALGLAKRGLNKGIFMMDYAYPTMLSAMGQVDVEWAFVHAIIRQESAFDDRAQSHAGARGLMQLMPATAKEVAQKAGIQHSTSWLTTRPHHNIFLGSRYLQQMLDRYDGSYVLAAAAYNGGPGRVDRWLKEIGDPREKEIDYINWVETIPIYETRNYVQRILEATYVYRLSLQDIQKKSPSKIHVALN
jgi:soluble lytic murein transglycosylase